jgi:hypothetical protein
VKGRQFSLADVFWLWSSRLASMASLRLMVIPADDPQIEARQCASFAFHTTAAASIPKPNRKLLSSLYQLFTYLDKISQDCILIVA